MKAFTQHQGLVGPMDRANVDTDMIIVHRRHGRWVCSATVDGSFVGRAACFCPSTEFVVISFSRGGQH